MCQVLEVSRSGYYDCLERGVGQRQLENKELKLKIAEIYWQNKGRYGSPRIHKQLKQMGYHHNIKRIERLMSVTGLKEIQKKKFKRTTDSDHKLPIKDNLIKRDFNITQPNTLHIYQQMKAGFILQK